MKRNVLVVIVFLWEFYCRGGRITRSLRSLLILVGGDQKEKAVIPSLTCGITLGDPAFIKEFHLDVTLIPTESYFCFFLFLNFQSIKYRLLFRYLSYLNVLNMHNRFTEPEPLLIMILEL